MIFNRKDNDNNESVIDKAANVAKRVRDKLHDFRKMLKNVGLAVSLEELQDNYAPTLDRIILKEEETKNCQYVGGEFRIALTGDGQYDCSYDLYFEDKDGRFHELSAQTEPLPLDGITADFRKELAEEKVLCFDLGEPSEESRRKYQEEKEQVTQEAPKEIATKAESETESKIDLAKDK